MTTISFVQKLDLWVKARKYWFAEYIYLDFSLGEIGCPYCGNVNSQLITTRKSVWF